MVVVLVPRSERAEVANTPKRGAAEGAAPTREGAAPKSEGAEGAAEEAAPTSEGTEGAAPKSEGAVAGFIVRTLEAEELGNCPNRLGNPVALVCVKRFENVAPVVA